jgi:hypothetical protein
VGVTTTIGDASAQSYVPMSCFVDEAQVLLVELVGHILSVDGTKRGSA